jgi:hypothetical protein
VAARHELPDCLPEVSRFDRIVVAFVGVAFDERLTQKARHLVAGDRPGALERRGREDGEAERRLTRGIPVDGVGRVYATPSPPRKTPASPRTLRTAGVRRSYR